MNPIRELATDPNFLRVSGVVATEMALYAMATVAKSHREETHQSVRLNRVVDVAARAVLWCFGTHARPWARPHLTHHSVTDANLGGILETADLLEHMDEHPDFDAPAVPDSFTKLDPIASLTPDQVKEIGSQTRQSFADRYQPKTSYTSEEAQAILYPDRPPYLYPKGSDQHPLVRRLARRKGEGDEAPAPGSIQAIAPELRDPHSPLLHEWGALGIQMRGIRTYKLAVDHYNQREANGELPGGDKLDDKIFDKSKVGIAVGYLGTAALVQLVLKDPSLTETVAYTTLTYPVVGQILKASSNAVNAWGHAGANARQALRNQLVPNADGTAAANTPNLFLKILTADEATNQANHHIWPWKIAYTASKGGKKFREAPFGSAVDWLTARRLGVQPGDHFGNPDVVATNDGTMGNGDTRPDMPLPAVQTLQRIRAEQIAARKQSAMLAPAKQLA